MENASKALIIAGAILIAIIIISMGIYIYYNATSTTTTNLSSTLTEMSIIEFNNKFTLYSGKQKGSNVKLLLETAANNNQQVGKEGSVIKYSVCIVSNDPSIINNFTGEMKRGLTKSDDRYYGVRFPENIRNIEQYINNNKTYNIWFSYNENGYVWEINIDEA